MQSVKAGLRNAYLAWQELGGTIDPGEVDELVGRTQLGYAMAMAASMAITILRVDRKHMVTDLADQLFNGDAGRGAQLADAAIERMRDDLQPAGADQYLFADALKPQFLIELYRGSIKVPASGGDAVRHSSNGLQRDDAAAGVTSE